MCSGRSGSRARVVCPGEGGPVCLGVCMGIVRRRAPSSGGPRGLCSASRKPIPRVSSQSFPCGSITLVARSRPRCRIYPEISQHRPPRLFSPRQAIRPFPVHPWLRVSFCGDTCVSGYARTHRGVLLNAGSGATWPGSESQLCHFLPGGPEAE